MSAFQMTSLPSYFQALNQTLLMPWAFSFSSTMRMTLVLPLPQPPKTPTVSGRAAAPVTTSKRRSAVGRYPSLSSVVGLSSRRRILALSAA